MSNRTINKLLCAMPLTDNHIEKIQNRLPNTEIICSTYNNITADDLCDIDVIFGNVQPKLLENAANIKWVQLGSAGADEYVPAIKSGLLVTNATGGYGETISEHILGMLLMLQKKFHVYYDSMKEGIWQRRGEVLGIRGSTTLVVGMGDIGGKFAEKMKMLGAYVIGIRRSDMRKPDWCDELYTMDHLDELLPRADSVVLVLPQSKETAGIMDKSKFDLMKDKSIFINVGRGSAVVQEDLIDALNNDRIWAAGLDVATPEPLPAGHPLWNAKNLLITPHTSGGFSLPKNTDDILEIFFDNLDRWQKNEKLWNIVDPETGYAKKNY